MSSLKVVGRWLPSALVKIAYGSRLARQGTDLARRRNIGEDAGDKRSPAILIGNVPKSAKNVEIAKFPDSGGFRDRRGKAGCWQSTPTDRRILAP